MVHQFPKKQIEELLRHFEVPESLHAFNWAKKFFQEALGSQFRKIEDSLLLTEVAIVIQSESVGEDQKNLFKLLFKNIRDNAKQFQKSVLQKTYNKLISSKKYATRKQTLKEKDIA